jgi:hypothetical protein
MSSSGCAPRKLHSATTNNNILDSSKKFNRKWEVVRVFYALKNILFIAFHKFNIS